MPFQCFVCERHFASRTGRIQHIESFQHQNNCYEFLNQMKENTCKLTVVQERKLKVANEEFDMSLYTKPRTQYRKKKK